MPNKDELEGKARELGGTAQEKAGEGEKRKDKGQQPAGTAKDTGNKTVAG